MKGATLFAQIEQLGAVNLTIAGILMSGLIICGAVIKTLWDHSQKRFLKVEEKLDECEKDRIRLWEQQAMHHSEIMKVLAELSANRP